MTSFRHLAAAGVLAAAGAAQADTANLVANGSFESGDFSSWQVSLGDATTFVDYGPPGRALNDATDGRFLAFFGSTEASGGSFISQSLSTVPGARYMLSFDLADDNGGAAAHNAFSVSIDGTSLFQAIDLATQNYVRETLAFTARGASSQLRLRGYNDIGYVQLDAVSVAAVPEPATAALLLAGAALLPLVRRRR